MKLNFIDEKIIDDLFKGASPVLDIKALVSNLKELKQLFLQYDKEQLGYLKMNFESIEETYKGINPFSSMCFLQELFAKSCK